MHTLSPQVRAVVGVVAVCALAGAGSFLALPFYYEYKYAGEFFPGVRIGEVAVAGKKPEFVRRDIAVLNDALARDGIPFIVPENQGNRPRVGLRIPSITYTAEQDQSFDVVVVLPEESVKIAYRTGREGGFSDRLRSILRAKFGSTHVPVKVEIDERQLRALLMEKLPPAAPAHNARIIVDEAKSGSARLVEGRAGERYDIEAAIENLRVALEAGEIVPVKVPVVAETPTLTAEEVSPLLGAVSSTLARAPITLTFKDPNLRRPRAWIIAQETVAAWLEPQKWEGRVALGLSAEKVIAHLEEIAREIEVEAQDARFSAGEEGRAAEFIPSRAGLILDREETYRRMNRAFLDDASSASTTIEVATEVEEPRVKTEEVNNLGIREILGVGRSNYKGSPPNRIKNIRNGVKKLSGILIKPNEEFSLLAALKPFTAANGYLPELVIKGDRIIPEIGGGLCQIGTTMFRAAMESAMTITARRNHSLVVRYYGDMRNGNPGTDATIYDPAPDFKFLNDTGNYLLLTTEMKEDTADLFFTLWGTSDGRKGEYTAPEVVRWIGAGAAKEVQTAELPPGKRKCQEGHVGAEAKFTYTVTRADGTKKETVYESRYRPLPKICLMGVAPEATEGSPPAEPSAGEAPLPVE